MKYIKTLNMDTGSEEFFLFSRDINHDCMAEAIRRVKTEMHGNFTRQRREPVSAGFISPGGNCHGESLTLGLPSLPSDTEQLKSQIATARVSGFCNTPKNQ